MRFWSIVDAAAVKILGAVVRAYQWTLSPLLGRQCRFVPSCSNYFLEAIAKYGSIVGTYRGVKRICRCHPWYRGNVFDPP
jgi:putative membrane protein insertion efficiency factor